MPYESEAMWSWKKGTLIFHSMAYCECIYCAAARDLAEAIFGWLR